MAHIVADRVKETTTTTGTGALTLAGAASGFRAFSAVCAVNDTVFYAIAGGSEWEVGLGTYSATNTLTRTTVLASSNAGSAVNLSAGSKDVFLTDPAAASVPMLRMKPSGDAGYDVPGAVLPATFIQAIATTRYNNVIYYEPFAVGLPGLTLAEVAFYVSTAASAGNTARLAIYRATADGQPGALVWGTTGISVATTGKKTAAPGVYLRPGTYLKAIWSAANIDVYAYRGPGGYSRASIAGYDLIKTATIYRDAASFTTWSDPGTAWTGGDNGDSAFEHVVWLGL